MARTIPIALQDHLETGATTNCYLIRIDPVTPGYASFGAALLDRDVIYDDGDGPLTYSAIVGMQPSTLLSRADLSVDGGEAKGLLPEFDFPISETDIIAGVYDFAEYTLYMVNYEDLAAGRVIMSAGTLGQFKVVDYGLSFVEELRGLSDPLKQSCCEKDSLSCRATFGSQPIGTLGAEYTERFPCGFDATSLLISFTVTSVGLETNITFTDSALVAATDLFSPGIMKWDTGANAGRSYEVESNTNTGTVTLAYPTAFPIQEGDTGKIRRDCNKQARDVSKGCKSHWGADWVNHFRGEPDIPIGDAGAMETPGASASPGGGGANFEPIGNEAEL